MTPAPTNAGSPGPIAGNRDRVAALAANVAALRRRFPGLDFARTVPGSLTVAVPAAEWPDGVVPPPPPAVDLRLRLGVTCLDCGADDWRQEKRGGPRCRPCDVRRCVEYQRLPRVAARKALKDRKRRARAALGAERRTT